MRSKLLAAAIFASTLGPQAARASVTLLEKDDWKITTEGFLELDTILDSHRGLGESPGNAIIKGPGTPEGRNGNFQASARNSRLGFSFYPPVQNDWKSKGVLELDLLGYDPKPGSSAVTVTNTESSFYSNPTMRIRHGYFNLQKNDWTFLVGQTWSLLGWQSSYTMTTASVGPVAGILSLRTSQATVIHTTDLGEGSKWQNAVSLARPTQRDSVQPNFNFGSRLTWGGRKAGIASAAGDFKLEPTSLAITGTLRNFATPLEPTGLEGLNHHSASAFAVDFALPLIAADQGTINPSNTLIWTGELSLGTGYGDEFAGWQGVKQLPDGTGLAGKTNLDPGLGGFVGNEFKLVRLQSWNSQLQYHFKSDVHMFATLGFGQLHAYNTGGLNETYDHVSVYFVNLFHDVTKQVRVGAEYAHFASRDQDQPDALNDRYQVNGYFRF